MTFPTEDTWTAPHAVAPEPHRWHAPDSESTETEVSELVAALVRAVQPKIVVETGSAFGHTTEMIGDALRRNGRGMCYSLEVDPGRVQATRDRIHAARLEDHVTVLQESSLDFIPPGPIGFALFDSLYELRVDEFLRYSLLGCLAPGTIVAFHDTTSGLRGHYMDVRAEIDRRLVGSGLIRPVYVPTPRGLAIAEVL